MFMSVCVDKSYLVCENFVKNIYKKALGFWGVFSIPVWFLVISVKNLVLITVYKLIIFLLKNSWHSWTKKTQEHYITVENKVARIIIIKTFQFIRYET